MQEHVCTANIASDFFTDLTERPTYGETPTISLDNDPAVTSTVETASLAGEDDDESPTGEDPLTQEVPTKSPTPDSSREDSDRITTTPKESTLTPPTLAMPPDHPLESELCLPLLLPLFLHMHSILTTSQVAYSLLYCHK